MNKLFVICSLSLLYFTFSCSLKEQKTAKITNNSIQKDDYIILDSLKINEYESLYCFICSDFSGGGEKVFISISNNVCRISKDKVLVEGEGVGGFYGRNNNIIYLFGYDKPTIINQFSIFRFEIRDLSDDSVLEIYRKKKFKRIHQYTLCN